MLSESTMKIVALATELNRKLEEIPSVSRKSSYARCLEATLKIVSSHADESASMDLDKSDHRAD